MNWEGVGRKSWLPNSGYYAGMWLKGVRKSLKKIRQFGKNMHERRIQIVYDIKSNEKANSNRGIET